MTKPTLDASSSTVEGAGNMATLRGCAGPSVLTRTGHQAVPMLVRDRAPTRVCAQPVTDWASATERQIISGLAAGDPGAFGELFSRFNGLLRKYLSGLLRGPLRHHVDDVVTDTLIDISQFFRRNPDSTQDNSALIGLVYRFASTRSQRKTMLYWQEAPSADEILQAHEPINAAAGPYDLPNRREEQGKQQLVAELLSTLSPHHQQVMRLRYLENLSHKEIAQQMSVNPWRVNRLITYARRRLRVGACRYPGCDRRPAERDLCIAHRLHRDEFPRRSVGELNNNARLNPRKVNEIREGHRSGASIVTLARRYNLGYRTVAKVLAGVTWRHVPDAGRPNTPVRPRVVDHRGQANPRAKLTADQVRQIRRLDADGGYTRRELAGKFNVSEAAVVDVVLRRNWKHVD